MPIRVPNRARVRTTPSIHRSIHPPVQPDRAIGLTKFKGVYFPNNLTMPLCNEGTIGDWIEDGRLSDDKVLQRFTHHLLDAMVYMHTEAECIHRDLKPENVFVRQAAGEPDPTLIVGDVASAPPTAAEQLRKSIIQRHPSLHRARSFCTLWVWVICAACSAGALAL